MGGDHPEDDEGCNPLTWSKSHRELASAGSLSSLMLKETMCSDSEELQKCKQYEVFSKIYLPITQ